MYLFFIFSIVYAFPMKKKPPIVIRLAVVCSFIFSQFIFIQPSYATTPTYTAEFTVSGFSGATWITRGGGFIWVSQTSAIKKVDETTGTITETFTLTSTPQEIVYDGTNIYALLANNKIVKIIVATSVVSYSSADACGAYSGNNSISANQDVIFVSCFSPGRVGRFQNTDLSVLESVTLTQAGRTVIANNSSYVSQFSGANPTWKYSLSSLSSPTSIATANYLASAHRVTADSNYVWVLSANNSTPIRLVRISLTDNSVTTYALSDYQYSTYTLNSISSDGTTVFISLGGSRAIVALDIATSSFSNVATPSSTPNGIQAVTNGFWVVVGSTLIKYSSASVPAAPTLNTFTAGDRRVTVAFTAGANNGAAITDYEYSLNGGSYTSAGTTTSPFTITGLSGRTAYSVTIKARNSVGLSTASSSLSATTTDSSLDASEEAARVAARVAAAEEAARVAAAEEAARVAARVAAAEEAARVAARVAAIELTLSLGKTTKSVFSTKCVKGKTIKYFEKGAKCPKGYVKK